MRKIIRLLAMLTAAAVLLCGCALRSQEPESPGEIAFPSPSEEPVNMILGEQLPAHTQNMTLYYVMSDGASFSTVTRSLRLQGGANPLEAAVNAVLSPAAGGGSMYFSTGDTKLLSCELACGIATVNLSIDARNAQGEQEMLALVDAIGNTLLGFDEVSGVNVLIGGQSETFSRLPLGIQTETVGNVAAAYAQLQAEAERFLGEEGASITRSAALYFPTSGGTWIIPELRSVTLKPGAVVQSLINALKSGPLMQDCATASIPDGVELLNPNPEIETLPSGEHVLSLDFSSTLANYLAFSGLEVWELLGSVTLTICSFLPELDAVRILVNGEPITICEADGELLSFPDGLIRRSDFASRIGTVATLYLSDVNGNLEPARRAVSLHSVFSPRRLITELFECAGQSGARLRFPIPDNIYAEDLLGIRVADGIASVNLSANFYRSCQNLDEVSERCLVYSIVNTLCQLDDVLAVRIYIEGRAPDTLAGAIYLRSPLAPNPGIIAAPTPAAG